VKPILRVVVAVIAALAVTGGAHFFLYQRVFAPLHPAGETWVLQFLVGFLWINLFLGFGVLRVLPQSLRRWYEALLFLWMGGALFLLMASVPVFLMSWIVSFQVTEQHQALATVVLAGVLSILGFYKAQRETVVHTELPLLLKEHVQNGAAVAPIRIAVISDVHVSGTLGARRLRRIVTKVNALEPDLIFVLGDLVDGSVRQLGQEVLTLNGLRTRVGSKEGVYFVTGNHEYFSGAASWKSFLKSNTSWTILENERRHIVVNGQRLVLVGIDDRQSLYGEKVFGPRQPDLRLSKALGGLDDSIVNESLVVLLAHQPKDALQLNDEPRVRLQVSGHTHGGQIWPFGTVARKDQGFLTGLYEVARNQWLYVCEGTCYWGLPFRLGTQCEISLLELKAAG
jgi:predicted MPP superfamily phosphohydrolase